MDAEVEEADVVRHTVNVGEGRRGEKRSGEKERREEVKK